MSGILYCFGGVSAISREFVLIFPGKELAFQLVSTVYLYLCVASLLVVD